MGGQAVEHAAQLGERERLVEVRPAEALEEVQGVTAHRVPRREDDPLGSLGVLLGEAVVHLPAAEVGHPQVADDDVEGVGDRPLEGVGAVARHLHGVSPALQRRSHVVEDVGLVIHDEHAQRPRLGDGVRRSRGGPRLGAARQLDGERHPGARPRVEGDAPAVFLHDPLRDREPQACAFTLPLGREERLEHALGDLIGDAGAVVGHAHGYPVEPAPGRDPDAAAPLDARDRLRGVVDEVYEHLFDLVRVDLEVGEVLLHPQRRLHLVSHQLVAEQRQRGRENRPDRLHLALALLAAREREEVLDDRRGALRFLADHLQRLGEGRRDLARLREEVRQAHDGSERVVEIVRHAGD